MIHVTDVLDSLQPKQLVEWRLKQGKKAELVSQEALRIGKQVDAYIQEHWRHRSEPLVKTDDLAILNCWQGWLHFLEDHPGFFASILAGQHELIDGELVGHPDLEVESEETPERWGIVDVKCSSAIRSTYWYQTAKYWHIRQRQREEHREPCLQGFTAILRLDKLGRGRGYEYREHTSGPQLWHDLSIFNAYYSIYQDEQQQAEANRLALEEEVLGRVS